MERTLKQFDNGRLSITVTKIDQIEEITSQRHMNPNEDFSTFHPNMTVIDNSVDNRQPPQMGTVTKNVGGFGITVTRSYR